MAIRRRKFLIPVLLVTLAVGTLVLVVARSRSNGGRVPSPQVSSPTFLQAPTSSATQRRGPRNLSLQAEAFNMGRRLGRRFSASSRGRSVLLGTLTIGTDQRGVNISRNQLDQGEHVEIAVVGSLSLLTWDAAQGALSSGTRATGSDRELIERLVLDSPDQFVLAQLRGASYFTVARNVRPANAGDNYTGPLWNIIRIGDPDPDETRRPQSRWRLYFLNAATGLIERIESETRGQRIVAEISGWMDVNGEKVPTQITWTRQGQTLMQYRLTSFSVAEM